MRVPSVFFAILLVFGSAPGLAAEIGPPMFDVTRLCKASSGHNETAMSECVVAESEARAEVLQNWANYSNDGALSCIKAGRKARRLPYTTMAKCLSAQTARPAVPAAAEKR